MSKNERMDEPATTVLDYMVIDPDGRYCLNLPTFKDFVLGLTHLLGFRDFNGSVHTRKVLTGQEIIDYCTTYKDDPVLKKMVAKSVEEREPIFYSVGNTCFRDFFVAQSLSNIHWDDQHTYFLFLDRKLMFGPRTGREMFDILRERWDAFNLGYFKRMYFVETNKELAKYFRRNMRTKFILIDENGLVAPENPEGE